MRTYVDGVLAILPFEPAAHQRLGGPPCVYVGHPLIERLAELRPEPREVQRRMPIRRSCWYCPAADRAKSAGCWRFSVTPLRASRADRADGAGAADACRILRRAVRDGVAGWAVTPRIVTEPAEKWAAFRSARAALAASGTVTLELALAGVPTVAAYRVTLIEEIIARAARINKRLVKRDPRQSGHRRECRAGALAA